MTGAHAAVVPLFRILTIPMARYFLPLLHIKKRQTQGDPLSPQSTLPSIATFKQIAERGLYGSPKKQNAKKFHNYK